MRDFSTPSAPADLLSRPRLREGDKGALRAAVGCTTLPAVRRGSFYCPRREALAISRSARDAIVLLRPVPRACEPRDRCVCAPCAA